MASQETDTGRSEEHTSELQSPCNLVCRLLLEKKQLRLGATGVRSAVDCTQPDGWRQLRDLVGHPASPVAARVLAYVLPALGEPSEVAPLFFEAVARLAPALSTVRGLARHLRVRPSTLMSRFHRAHLPSPKSYLAGMRLLHASYLFQNPGLSV